MNYTKLLLTGILLILGGASYASGSETEETEEKKKKVEASVSEGDPVEDKTLIKADSLQQDEKVARPDSVANPHNSTMSSMSYNILFQVIYRYSFSEIFSGNSSNNIPVTQ